MGVQGLQTYMLQHGGDNLRRHRLRDCRLVIDAANLAHHLYHLHRIDYLYAGEYDLYARQLRRAFAGFVECRIEPLFVLDGAKDWAGPKLREQRARLERRARKCAQVKQRSGGGGGDDGGNRLLPVLALDVFVACVAEFNFQLVVSPAGDADELLASLACQLACPVLTNDSDFLIFDLPGGVVLTKTLRIGKPLVDETEEEEETAAATSSGAFLDCQLYRVADFYLPALRCKVNPRLLPLCATLIGNDYLSRGAVGRCVLSRVQLPKTGGRKGSGSGSGGGSHRLIAGMLAWTHKNFAEPADCLAALRRLLLGGQAGDDNEGDVCEGKQWASKFLASVEESMAHYRLRPSLTLAEDDGRLRLLAFSDSLQVPQWLAQSGMLLPMQRQPPGHSSLLFLDVTQYGRVFLPVGLEDVAQASGFDASAGLRRLAYALRLAALDRLGEFPSIVEFHRRQAGLGKTELALPAEPDSLLGSAAAAAAPPSPSSPAVVAWLAEQLGWPGDPLAQSVSQPGVRAVLYAALMSHRALLEGSTVAPRTVRSVCLAVIATCLHRLSELLLTPVASAVEVEVEEAQATARRRVMAKYAEPPVVNNRVKYDIAMVHCVSHFQATLLSATLLVQAHQSYYHSQLGSSLDDAASSPPVINLPPVAQYLAGRCLYNLASDVESRKDGVLFLSEILVRRSRLADAFNRAAELMRTAG